MSRTQDTLGKKHPKGQRNQDYTLYSIWSKKSGFSVCARAKKQTNNQTKKNQQTNKTKTALNSSVTSSEIQRYVGSFTPWHIKNENQWCEGNWKDRMT